MAFVWILTVASAFSTVTAVEPRALAGADDRANGADLASSDAGALEEARVALEATLRGMAAAVTAADPDGYLSWIDASEPHFAKEQRNWAADLRRHRPDSIEFRVVGLIDRSHEGGGSAAKSAEEIWCDLEIGWSMPATVQEPEQLEEPGAGGAARIGGANGEPAGKGGASGGGGAGGVGGVGGWGGDSWSRTVRFPARFVQDESSDPPRWRYAGEAWRTLRSEDGRNTVCYAEGFEEGAKRVLEILPSARRRVDRLFAMELEHEQVVKLYPDAQWLLASIYLSYRDPIGGWNEPGESIKLLGRRVMGERAALGLLSHEYGHVATFVFDEHASEMAWWAVEGVAEVAAFIAARSELEEASAFEANTTFISPGAWRRVLGWHKAGKLAGWEEMADFRKTPAALGGHVYKQGEHMVGFIGERYGRAKMIAWISTLARGASVEEATQRELGMGFEALSALWRAAVVDRAEAEAVQEEENGAEKSGAVTPGT